MPNQPAHSYWSLRATGAECPLTHRLIDSFSSTKGSGHRDWLHDPVSAMMAADRAEGFQCRGAALNHLAVDRAYGAPDTKIIMEMIRLTDPVGSPASGQLAGGTAMRRCRISRA